ncbi:hypothetical protein HW450_06530 [Corynebacterium hindlerae]|uniref:Uncharacterized protein n=1 Tax=Corynebacterium hindlerae TaxID=699041 RepID=A0A7G5FIA6_9CORY|nr:hypothetical protein [Corynebacterium hindlerae]QMV86347.1 hypothetical protein HW450_06530 [Corynebacterium hindlerae]
MNTIRNNHPALAQAIYTTGANPTGSGVDLNKLEDLVLEAATLINPALADTIAENLRYGATLEISTGDWFDKDIQVEWEFMPHNSKETELGCGTFEEFLGEPADIMISIGFNELVDTPLANQEAAA